MTLRFLSAPFIFLRLIFFCICLSGFTCMYVCVCVQNEPASFEGQEKALLALELMLPVVGSHHVHAGTQRLIFCKIHQHS